VSAPAAERTGSRPWSRVVLLGVAYCVIGTVTAALARGSHGVVVAWRLTAWALSAVVFGAQIWFEVRRSGCAPVRAALRAALAVAVGGLLLALWATGHALSVHTARIVPQLIALVVWPVLLFVPAFLVAWLAAALLAARKGA